MPNGPAGASPSGRHPTDLTKMLSLRLHVVYFGTPSLPLHLPARAGYTLSKLFIRGCWMEFQPFTQSRDVINQPDALRERMGRQAAETARRRFDLERQVDEYLGWYEEILERRKAETSNALPDIR